MRESRSPIIKSLGTRLGLALLQPRFSAPLCIVLALVAGTMAWRASRVADVPDLGDPFDVDAWRHPAIDPADDAFEDYETAARLLTGSSPSFNLNWQHWDEVDLATRAWLEQNQSALAPWRAGTEKRAVRPNARDARDSFWSLCTLVWLQAIRESSAGRHGEAAQLLLALCRSERQAAESQRKEQDDSFLVGPCACLWLAQLAPELSESELEETLAALRSDACRPVLRSTLIKADYSDLLENLSTNPSQILRGPLSEEGWAKPFERFLANEPERSRRILRQAYWNMIDDADRIESDRLLPAAGPDGVFREVPGPGRVTVAKLEAMVSESGISEWATNYGTLRRMHHSLQSVRELSIMVLAAHLFRHRTGDFPASAAELVASGIVDEIPLDHFTPIRTPFRYRRDAEEIVVWSVGDDQTDDGGNGPSREIETLLDLDDGIPRGDLVLRSSLHPPARAELPVTPR